MEMSEWLMISRALPASWQTCAEGVLMFGAYCGDRTAIGLPSAKKRIVRWLSS
jgi:hypothetical protein